MTLWLLLQVSSEEHTEVKAGRIGRDHHPTAFSAMLAGGGIKGGTVYGKSDERHTM